MNILVILFLSLNEFEIRNEHRWKPIFVSTHFDSKKCHVFLDVKMSGKTNVFWTKMQFHDFFFYFVWFWFCVWWFFVEICHFLWFFHVFRRFYDSQKLCFFWNFNGKNEKFHIFLDAKMSEETNVFWRKWDFVLILFKFLIFIQIGLSKFLKNVKNRWKNEGFLVQALMSIF